MAVDGSGNVYIADDGNNAIKEWNAATQTVNTLASSGLGGPFGVAVDGLGNVYYTDFTNVSRSCRGPSCRRGPVNEGAAAGCDALPTVLPSGESLTGIFAPTSDQSWLTIGSVSGGVVNFSFTQNTGAARTAHITSSASRSR